MFEPFGPWRKVAVVAAHPDDEVLGFGGAMRRLTQAGVEVSVLIMATGLAARADRDADALAAGVADLRETARAANAELGVTDVGFCDFADNAMDGVPLLDVVKAVEEFLDARDCEAIFTHHSGDLNVDHRVVSQAVQTAARPLPDGAPAILHGEVLSSSEYALPEARFQPNCYVELGPALEVKCTAMAHYDGELRDFPHPRSLQAIRHLAGLRGSECGVQAAEAFRLVRAVNRL